MGPQTESGRARAALEVYLALGPTRSLDKLRAYFASQPRPVTTRLHTLKDWSAAFGWVERAKAYDAEQAARERRQREEHDAAERQRRHERRLADLDALRPVAEQALELLADQPIRLLGDPKDVLKFFESIHKGERLEMGEPSAIVNLQEMSNVELAAYAEAHGFHVRVPPAPGTPAPPVDGGDP